MQLPKGDVSVSNYKSKYNVIYVTIYNAKTNTCNCYIRDETNGNRGVDEIGTCVLDYIKGLSEAGETEIIFNSDNCAGQQKNKFMLALYMYAVIKFKIVSIAHKFLIRDHIQNEGDSAHSLIERQVKRILKSGFQDFTSIKSIVNDIGPMNCKDLKLLNVKVMKLTKQSLLSVFL